VEGALSGEGERQFGEDHRIDEQLVHLRLSTELANRPVGPLGGIGSAALLNIEHQLPLMANGQQGHDGAVDRAVRLRWIR
jgi:hypothetical protein